MDLSYCDGTGKNVTAVYEGASENGLMHTIRLEDGARLDTHDINLQLLKQPDFQIPIKLHSTTRKGRHGSLTSISTSFSKTTNFVAFSTRVNELVLLRP